MLLLTTLVTGFFVWRFTRPSKSSIAARKLRVATRVGLRERTDEMGTLASAFNEMTAQLIARVS